VCERIGQIHRRVPRAAFNHANHPYVNVCALAQLLLSDGLGLPVTPQHGAKCLCQISLEHSAIVAGRSPGSTRHYSSASIGQMRSKSSRLLRRELEAQRNENHTAKGMMDWFKLLNPFFGIFCLVLAPFTCGISLLGWLLFTGAVAFFSPRD
jgi:hypothetical protein